MANLTFKSNGATQVALNKINSPYTTTIQYSKNSGAWSNVQFGTAISLSNNDTVSFSGNARFSKNIQNKYQFTTAGEGTLTLSGDLISLVSGTTVEDDYEFNSLFKDCENIVDASQLTLPSNTTNWCYTNMFFGCTNLSAAPTFVATEVKQWSYANMFVKCFALSTAPTLPTAIQNDHSCSNMFHNCTSLQNCTNVYNTRNGNWMYNAMFQGCKNLSVLANLPYIQGGAPSGGYSSMFRNCDNITLAPRYNFTSLPPNSFNFMFDRADKVNALEVTFTEWPEAGAEATSCFLKDVASTGVFVGPSALTRYIPIHQQTFPDQMPPEDWQILSYETMPLTFRAVQANTSATVKLVKVNNTHSINLKYRKNHAGDWSKYDIGSTISLNPGECVSFSGANSQFSGPPLGTDVAFYRYQTTGAQMHVYGNVMSLVNNATTLGSEGQFCYLFAGCTNIVDANKLYLPATNTTKGCYMQMFSGCTGLEWGPVDLPAQSLTSSCYRDMFNSCTSLRRSPLIHGTPSNSMDMQYMFRYCTTLSAIGVKFTSWGSNDATYYWVDGVPSSGTRLFLKYPALATEYGPSRIPSGWTVRNQ